MPQPKRKPGPEYTPPKSSLPKKDYTPNQNPHPRKPIKPDRNLGRQDPTKRMSNRQSALSPAQTIFYSTNSIDSLHAAELISLAKLFVSQWCDLEAQKVKNEHKL
ncbi:uncharacterized protein RSE6_05141 [Rhynchosporium secalis]|uniref:Uncharacterized protein n=1 Tax=Rhynchosporium secalis TaxID=38038 RepID=A0A1E1M715_RHYSE|nr:uncharacterized protein RSE6_05141 [Rhynchosporium secalis]